MEKGLGFIRSTKSEQIAQWINQEVYASNRPSGGGLSTFGQSDKGKAVVCYGGQNDFAPIAFKGNNSSQSQCFTCGEKGHNSYVCLEWQVNLAKLEDIECDELKLVYDEHIEGEQVDAHPIQGESLVVRRVMTTLKKEEKED